MDWIRALMTRSEPICQGQGLNLPYCKDASDFKISLNGIFLIDDAYVPKNAHIRYSNRVTFHDHPVFIALEFLNKSTRPINLKTHYRIN